jgi:hypothetical protein
MTVSAMPGTTRNAPGMRFSVDAWDVGYGTALADGEEDLPASAARVETDVETPAGQWAPIPAASDVPDPSAVLFVDGVRRIDARVWIDESPAPGAATTNAARVEGAEGAEGVEGIAATAAMSVCASYAAGVVCCCGRPGRRQAHLVAAEIRRGLFTTAPHATDIQTRAGTYRARHTVGGDTVPLTMALSNAPQRSRSSPPSPPAPRCPALPNTPAPHRTGRTQPMMTCSSSTVRCATGLTCPAPWGSSRRTGPGTWRQS